MKELPNQESLTVEFKSDLHKLPDRELIAAIACMANAEGGFLYLGVENDGKPTGLHKDHQNLSTLAAFIANRTIPSLSVSVSMMNAGDHQIARIAIPKSRQLISTSDGLLLRRRLSSDGSPECVPFSSYDVLSRQSDLGMLDYSARPIHDADTQVFDPLERVRLRQMVERYGGDQTLLALSDEELDGALGFTHRDSGKVFPTVTGLLMIGRESALRQHVPTYEIAFQVLEGTEVRVNDFYRAPLLNTFSRILEQFEARLEEDEVQVGLFRVPIPTYERRAFREALINALVHRDYTRLGAIHIRFERNALTVSNPGGFVEGVSIHNLLVTEPRPRNPTLADAAKRIGLAERTGRGVDLIYSGLLRYGRPAPDYSQSSIHSVILHMSSAEADVPFLRLIIAEEEQSGEPLPVDTLIALSRLREERRVGAPSLAKAIQKDVPVAKALLERLVEAGIAQAYGSKSRTYTLSRNVYKKLGQSEEYTRQAGMTPEQQEVAVLNYMREHGKITRREATELCGLTETQASRLLIKLTKENKLTSRGVGRGTYYILP